MRKVQLREKVTKTIERMVRNTVGRSIPINFHEPKLPECLKKNK